MDSSAEEAVTCIAEWAKVRLNERPQMHSVIVFEQH